MSFENWNRYVEETKKKLNQPRLNTELTRNQQRNIWENSEPISPISERRNVNKGKSATKPVFIRVSMD